MSLQPAVKGLESITLDLPTALAELELILPGVSASGGLEFRLANTITDAAGWLGWARRWEAETAGGYTVRVARDEIYEVLQAAKVATKERSKR